MARLLAYSALRAEMCAPRNSESVGRRCSRCSRAYFQLLSRGHGKDKRAAAEAAAESKKRRGRVDSGSHAPHTAHRTRATETAAERGEAKEEEKERRGDFSCVFTCCCWGHPRCSSFGAVRCFGGSQAAAAIWKRLLLPVAAPTWGSVLWQERGRARERGERRKGGVTSDCLV